MTIIISHSEVDSYLGCERKHLYAHGYKLMPKRLGHALYRGIALHSWMRAYFQTLQATDNHGQSVAIGNEVLDKIAMEPDARYDQLIHIQRIIPVWYNWYEQNHIRNYRPIHVEEEFRLQVTDGVVYPFKPDLIMEDLTRNGDLVVFDHKCLYNFYTLDDIPVQPQLPKYIGALRAMGFHVSRGIYNMVRWRKDAKEVVKWATVTPNNERVRRTFKEQLQAMEEIAELKAKPFEEWVEGAKRNMNSFNCKNCGMKPLCVSQLNGVDITLMSKVEFTHNTYGYGEIEDD